MNEEISKFVLGRLNLHGKSEPTELQDAYLKFKSCMDNLRKTLSDEQKKLLNRCENAYALLDGETVDHYYRTGFSDAVIFLDGWKNGKWITDKEGRKNMLIDEIKKLYPIGSRVELVKMDDKQAPPVGTKGTVKGVDDIGSIMVDWDNGCGLNVVYGEDVIKKLDSVKTVCYGKEQIWDSRDDAIKFFSQAMAASEGSEHQRYYNIYAMLISGEKTCIDTIE